MQKLHAEAMHTEAEFAVEEATGASAAADGCEAVTAGTATGAYSTACS